MKKIIMCLLLQLFAISAFSQKSIYGIITDKDDNNKPIEFASVKLFSLTGGDSTFIAGTYSQQNGHFKLSVNDSYAKQEYGVVISNIGYVDYRSSIVIKDSLNLGVISLEKSTTLLSEVEVRGGRKTISRTSRGFSVNVENSFLKNIGNAIDVFEKIPLIRAKADGKFDIIGKGEAIVYINNKLVQNNDELRILNSDQIKKTEIIVSPGAQYNASVNAVIKITTKGFKADNFALSLYNNVGVRHKLNNYNSASLSYSNDKMRFYGNATFNNMNINQTQVLQSTITDGVSNHNFNDKATLNMGQTVPALSLGMDYSYKNNTFGAKATYSKTIRQKANVETNGLYDNSNGTPVTYKQLTELDANANDFGVNAFYIGQFNNFNLSFNTDFLTGESKSTSNITTENNPFINLSSGSHHVFANRLDMTYKYKKSIFEFGSEYINTLNKSSFSTDNSNLKDELPDTQTQNNYSYYSLYTNYSIANGNFSLNTGVRAEFTSSKDSKNSNVVNKNNFFGLYPTINMGYYNTGKDFSLNISYRRIINKPSYYQLRSEIQYNTPFSNETGNNLLKNTYINDFTLLSTYKNFNFTTSFKHYENNILFFIQQYKDEAKTLSTFKNVDNFKSIFFSLNYSKTLFKRYTPNATVSFTKQFFREGELKYNTPEFSLSVYNRIILPKSFEINVDFDYQNSHSSNYMLDAERYILSLSVSKSFKTSGLYLTLGVNDLLASKELWDMHYMNVYTHKNNTSDSRYFYLRASYNLNKILNYKGKGAGSSEKNRLNTL